MSTKQRISSKFQSLSTNLNERPRTAGQNPEETRISQRNLCEISCLVQKSLENLLRRENFFKSPDLTRISHREKSQQMAQTSIKLRVSNKSAEYHEFSAEKDAKIASLPKTYAKFKENFESSVQNGAGFFVYMRNVKERHAFLRKIQRNAGKTGVCLENCNKIAKKIHNNGKISILRELKDKSLGILEETLGFQREKRENEEYKREIARNLQEMCEINEKLQGEK